MKIQVVDNVLRKMAETLAFTIERSSDIRIAVAFLSRGGLALVNDAVEAALRKGAYLEFLIGLDAHITEPTAVKALYSLSLSDSNVALYCYASTNKSSMYHPKMYLLKESDEVTAIVGSSNLTEGGLKRNIEANIFINATTHDEVISDIYMTYNQLKFLPDKLIPDEESLSLYDQLYNTEKEGERRLARDANSQTARRNFTEKLKTLQRPSPTRRDLVGWMELVYKSLPKGEFTTQSMYENVEAFRQRYPDNANIRAKIR